MSMLVLKRVKVLPYNLRMRRIQTRCPCGKNEVLIDQGYCRECKNRKQREWRAANPPTEIERMKDACRSLTRVARLRGELTPKPCEDCGNPEVVTHHDDYQYPMRVTWLCVTCHNEFHRKESVLMALARAARVKEMLERKARGLSPYLK